MPDTTRSLIVDQCARLRLACMALGIEPKHVRLEDLAPEVADGLRRQANQDLTDLIAAQTTDAKATLCNR